MERFDHREGRPEDVFQDPVLRGLAASLYDDERPDDEWCGTLQDFVRAVLRSEDGENIRKADDFLHQLCNHLCLKLYGPKPIEELVAMALSGKMARKPFEAGNAAGAFIDLEEHVIAPPSPEFVDRLLRKLLDEQQRLFGERPPE